MRLGRLGPAAAATAFLPPIGCLILLGTMNQSAPWLQSHGALGVLLFVVAFSVFGGLALLPTYAPSVLGGWAFGMAVGLAATLAGFVGAAAIGFAIARRLSGDRLVQVLDEYPRGQALHRALLSGSWRADPAGGDAAARAAQRPLCDDEPAAGSHPGALGAVSDRVAAGTHTARGRRRHRRGQPVSTRPAPPGTRRLGLSEHRRQSGRGDRARVDGESGARGLRGFFGSAFGDLRNPRSLCALCVCG